MKEFIIKEDWGALQVIRNASQQTPGIYKLTTGIELISKIKELAFDVSTKYNNKLGLPNSGPDASRPFTVVSSPNEEWNGKVLIIEPITHPSVLDEFIQLPVADQAKDILDRVQETSEQESVEFDEALLNALRNKAYGSKYNLTISNDGLFIQIIPKKNNKSFKELAFEKMDLVLSGQTNEVVFNEAKGREPYLRVLASSFNTINGSMVSISTQGNNISITNGKPNEDFKEWNKLKSKEKITNEEYQLVKKEFQTMLNELKQKL